MKEEVDSAAAFLAGLLTKHADSDFLEFFQYQMGEELKEKYTDHWHPLKPNRGSAYRSITIQYKCVDEKILEALTKSFICVNRMTEQEARLEASKMSKHLPQELTMWIDPRDVSYRIGDHGSIGVIFSGPSSTTSCPSDNESEASSSRSSSTTSSPCSSPPPPASPPHLGQHYLHQPPPPLLMPHFYPYPPPQRQCRTQAQAYPPHQTYHMPQRGTGLVYS